MWVQLKTTKHIEVQGKPRTFSAGDWVDVGKQTALRWISENAAWIPEGKAADLLTVDSGVFIWGNATKGKERLGDYVGKVEIQVGDRPTLPWSKTLIYSPSLRLRKELLPVGFHLLDTWQLALPIWDYEKLAIHQGDEADRQRTKAIVRDLRVPLYAHELLFVRRCGDTERFVARWVDEMQEGGDPRFALLRALYETKPLVLALPTTWVWKNMDTLTPK